MKIYKKNERTSRIFSYEVNLSLNRFFIQANEKLLSIGRLQVIIPCLSSLFSQNLKEKDLLTANKNKTYNLEIYNRN